MTPPAPAATSSPAPDIEIKNLTHACGRAEAVHDFSLTVLAGRCHGLFGRNGAGAEMQERLRALSPESLTSEALTLEEIFVATLKT